MLDPKAIADEVVVAWLNGSTTNTSEQDANLLREMIRHTIRLDRKQRSTCAEHKRALVCPNCEARRRGKKGALAVSKKYDKATRVEWARKGGRPVTRSDAQESSLNVANE